MSPWFVLRKINRWLADRKQLRSRIETNQVRGNSRQRFASIPQGYAMDIKAIYSTLQVSAICWRRPRMRTAAKIPLVKWEWLEHGKSKVRILGRIFQLQRACQVQVCNLIHSCAVSGCAWFGMLVGCSGTRKSSSVTYSWIFFCGCEKLERCACVALRLSVMLSVEFMM